MTTVTVTVKDTNLYDSIKNSLEEQLLAKYDVTELNEEQQELLEAWMDNLIQKFVSHGEYLRIQFDAETLTAKVIERK